MSAHLTDSQVRVSTFVTGDAFPDCDNCGTRNTGINGIHWDAQDEPFGLLNVCDTTTCLDHALSVALDDAPLDSTVTCEHQVHPVTLGVAA